MTDEQIIEALEWCAYLDDCVNCPYYKKDCNCATIALDIIYRQKAEIERLNGELQAMRGAANSYRLECTGLRDKNGKLIFKDDVLKGFSYPFLSDEGHNYYAIVVWFEDSAAFGIYTIKNPESKVRGISSGNTEYMSEWDSNNWEIIGNIHDNPELTEVEK